MADERYVLRHELEQTKGTLHKRINQVDSKHDDKHSDLKLLLHTFMESQKPLNKTLESIDGKMETLNTTMAGYKDRIVDIEYVQKDQSKRLKGIEETQKSKKDQNTKIIIALIGAVSTLGAAAFGLAQFFF
ncbi:hypothetical protein [Jeotgalicoccus sp. S0W5]|uniref:hypothetical protein n=1 Tax=Jeotgalicoccus sp. S0W5 TaxID=2527874 RepID=UPI0014152B48|nr:hypothetical protein [Jeotgalicoccus sp. S0W5]